MGQFVDLTGEEFGRWRVVERAENVRTSAAWLCECQCPLKTRCVVVGVNLRRGGSTNCGCVRKESTSKARKKHGETGSKVYYVWQAMIQRCTNPNNKSYPDYGGRGISVCDRWREENGFNNFKADMGDRPAPTSTVEREDVNGNYCPENCVWIERREQNRNRQNTLRITFRGEERLLVDVARECRISHGALHHRLTTGMTPEDAVQTVPVPRKRTWLYRGEEKTLKELEGVSGVKAGTIRQRLVAYGWSIEEAVETPPTK